MTQYYTLISSLPYLVHFEKAQRLSISRLRLDERLTFLDEEDAEQLQIAEQLLQWRYQPLRRSAHEVANQFAREFPRLQNRELREFVSMRYAQRTIVAGLRKRHVGEPPPAAGEVWGVAERSQKRLIEKHWSEPEFGLGRRYPWLGETAQLLEDKNALAIERLQMDVIWRYLSRVADASPFGFEAVFAYVFKWDITNRWLGSNAQGAAQRFETMIQEGLRNVEPIVP